ncbi:MAG TPA: HEAT repeat domain-containing protein, partial [Nannocystis sp.]
MTATTSSIRPELATAIADPGFTPGRADLQGVIDLLADADEDAAERAERALLRAGSAAGPALQARLSASVAPLRARIVRVLGRLAIADAGLRAPLLACIADTDPRARRNAIVALGKLADPAAAAALVAHARVETSTPHLRSLVEALGKCGDEQALAWLDGLDDPDPELQRLRGRARIMLGRSLGRETSDAAIDDDAVAAAPRSVIATCRPGLEDILVSTIDPALSPGVAGPGKVGLKSAGPLRELGRARTLMTLGFPLPRVRLAPGPDALVEALTAALTGPEAREIFATWSKGQVRYRLAWARGGHRRAVVWKVAAAVGKVRPDFINDPTASPWEVVVDDGGGQLQVELRPRWTDTRFAYRVGDVPAASHPTIAAALAMLGGVRADDVVWDPFMGSGLELVERGLLGPYARLVGTDLDSKALATATANLKAAGLERFEVVEADATTYVPADVSLIITNPPMGRRVQRGDVAPLLTGFV